MDAIEFLDLIQTAFKDDQDVNFQELEEEVI